MLNPDTGHQSHRAESSVATSITARKGECALHLAASAAGDAAAAANSGVVDRGRGVDPDVGMDGGDDL